MVRDSYSAVDRLPKESSACAGGVKRFGNQPVVRAFEAGGATVEIAARVEHRDRVVGLFVARLIRCASSSDVELVTVGATKDRHPKYPKENRSR